MQREEDARVVLRAHRGEHARGGAGVSKVLELMRHEMMVAMALTGQTDVKTLDPSVLRGKAAQQTADIQRVINTSLQQVKK